METRKWFLGLALPIVTSVLVFGALQFFAGSGRSAPEAPAKHQKWEYKILMWEEVVPLPWDKDYSVNATKGMSGLGADGWEFVTFFREANDNKLQALFRRPK
jgi:hypothetical protein